MPKITVGDYLLRRIKELGITDVLGVPGDYNLGFLDQIVAMENIEWRGTCNELNAAYAADGYARIRGASALVTTFGVGELSAINGIAGAYAEYVPIINIVGMPALATQEKHLIVHHTLGDGNFSNFIDMYWHVTIEQVVLTPLNAAHEIDRILTACWVNKRPVYIGLPTDVSSKEIELDIIEPLSLIYPTSDTSAVGEAVERTAHLIEKSKKPLFLVDICAQRHSMKPFIEDLIDKTGICFASMNMGKGYLNESHSKYLGTYNGQYSSIGVQERVETSDCLIIFGSILSDFNTGGFTAKLNTSSTIEVHSQHVDLKHSCYNNVCFYDFIPLLIKRLENVQFYELPCKKPIKKLIFKENETLVHDRLWQQIRDSLNANDIILAEAGTSMFGTLSMPIPDNTTYIAQTLWGSIGYTVGAILGTSLAAPDRQSVLFIGDGSFQLSAQEISTMIRYKNNPIIFLINNDGYTVERVIHGSLMPYNDIQMWKYSELPQVFGENTWSCKVTTETQLKSAINQLGKHSDKLRFIEVVMDKNNSPQILEEIGRDCAKQNSY